MENNYTCIKCWKFPLKYNQDLDLYYCPNCHLVYQKMGVELEPILFGDGGC